MADQKKNANILRRIARIWGTISLLFLLFMLGTHILGSFSGSPEADGFGSTADFISFLFFPVSTIIGLALSWKWEGLGGAVTVVGMIAFHIIRPDLILDPMIDGLAAPGVLFLICWGISRGRSF
ncbi:MAG: hypothetical protein P8Z38_08430 [Robiginitalea sp.]|jgi:hypothetical protein